MWLALAWVGFAVSLASIKVPGGAWSVIAAVIGGLMSLVGTIYQVRAQRTLIELSRPRDDDKQEGTEEEWRRRALAAEKELNRRNQKSSKPGRIGN